MIPTEWLTGILGIVKMNFIGKDNENWNAFVWRRKKFKNMYRILIVEDDMGIAQAMAEQARMWELEVKLVYRNSPGIESTVHFHFIGIG